MHDDRLSKPATDRFFPYASHEFIARIVNLRFTAYDGHDRVSALLENCNVECPLGYQLCSFLRQGYVAQFSLPGEVAPAIARRAVDVALTRLREIDAGPELAVRDQQFVIYRAYLGPLGALSITQHVVSGGRRAHLRFRAASQLSKAQRDPENQTIIFQTTLGD